MPFPRIFKKKAKEVEIKKKEKKVEERPVEEPVDVKHQQPRVKTKKVGEAYRVLKTPQVTEKATGLVGQNQYVFKVWPRANKVEAKKAIEGLYGVDVISVKIIKVPRKRRRLGKIQGFRKGYKKAIVKIKEGQKIEVLPR